MAYELSKEFVWKEVGDQVVVLNLDSGNYHSLNPTASLIWRGLMERRSEEEIVQTLCSGFRVDPQTAGRDTEEAISEFVSRGMIAACTAQT
jgi:hypothetical protein